MEEKRALQVRTRLPNPETRAAHKREFGRQVLLPFFIFVFLAAGAIAALIYFKVGTVERWSQISSMLLISLGMLLSLILLVILVGLVYLVGRILQLVPPYTRLAQDGIETIKHQVAAGADITVKPVIKIQSFLAVIDALLGRR